jgi:hypothetical protein
MEGELEEILKNISKDPNSRVLNKRIYEKGKDIITVFHGHDWDCDGDIVPMPIITFDTDEKYGFIWGDSSKTILLEKEFVALWDYINKNDYILG